VEKTQQDLGKPKYKQGTIATPAIILCKTEKYQTFDHLNIMGLNRKQFGMVLSYGDKQETKLSLIIKIAKEIWPSLDNVDLKK